MLKWSASFNAVILSLLQSAKINNLNPIAYLHYYLDACAEAGGVPPDLERFHPHNVSPEDLEKYGMFSDKIVSWAKNLVDPSNSNEDE